MNTGKLVGFQIALLWLLMSAFADHANAGTLSTIAGAVTYSGEPKTTDLLGFVKLTYAPKACVETQSGRQELEKQFQANFDTIWSARPTKLTITAIGHTVIAKRAYMPDASMRLELKTPDASVVKKGSWKKPGTYRWTRKILIKKGDLSEINASLHAAVNVLVEDPKVCIDKLVIRWNYEFYAGQPPKPTPAPSATPAPTADPAPSSAPAPTASPAPTATPAPSATPSPKPSATPAPRWYALDFSLVSSRKGARALNNAYFGNEDCIFVFISPIWDNHIQAVRFYLDETPYRGEFHAPFDFEGTAEDGNAEGFNLADIDHGWHEITAVMSTTEGERTIKARFYKATPCESCWW